MPVVAASTHMPANLSVSATRSHAASSSSVHGCGRFRPALRCLGTLACSAGFVLMYCQATASLRARCKIRWTFLTDLGARPRVCSIGARPRRKRLAADLAAWIDVPHALLICEGVG